MFDDGRSRSVVFVAHCILNQNAISDGTADYPGCVDEILEILRASGAGIVQMPCPELHCLGLDRGDIRGGSRPVVEENTRIREMLSRRVSAEKIRRLAQHVLYEMLEYRKDGFEIKGVVGMNRSPSCGVGTTSRDNQEVAGEGVFIEALRQACDEQGIRVDMVGIKASEIEKAVMTVKTLLVAHQ